MLPATWRLNPSSQSTTRMTKIVQSMVVCLRLGSALGWETHPGRSHQDLFRVWALLGCLRLGLRVPDCVKEGMGSFWRRHTSGENGPGSYIRTIDRLH